MSVEETLEEAGIIRVDRDLRLLEEDELRNLFGASSSGRIILRRLLRSVIWQAYERIRDGSEPGIGGNLRTCWYRWCKPVLSHVPDDDLAKTDPYDVMLSIFTELVGQGLFKYQDFDFTDENWENRRIGSSRPWVLVFSEKRGWIRFLREIHEEFSTSVIALGGAPSALTSEYTARDISARIGRRNWRVHLIGIVDYDPAGDIIAESFRRQLEDSGLRVTELELLVHPRYYSEDQISVYRFPLPTGQKTKNQKWLDKTGGIENELFGLEAESMDRQRLKELVRERVSSLR